MHTYKVKIEILRKRIKNMHLHVRRDGSVYVSAPLSIDSKEIENFVVSHMNWIRSVQERYKNEQSSTGAPLYVTGETLLILGREYKLEVILGNGSDFFLKDGKAYLITKPNSSEEERALCVREGYRRILHDTMDELFPKWEKITGLKANETRIKNMRTRWGTCNPSAKRIWLSLLLVHKPVRCIEYVILHELSHFRVHNHGALFQAELDKYMPNWRDIKKELNEK